MKRLLRTITALTILLTFVSANLLPLAAQQRGIGVRVKKDNGQTEEVQLYQGSHALIIGVSDYTNGWKSLPGVKSDVTAVSAALKANGFNVRELLDPTRSQLVTGIDSFINDYGYEPGNRLLIYFAGHGHTQKAADGRDLGYIVPTDAPLPSKNDILFRRTALSMNEIDNYARRIEAKHALFIFDSCFSGSLLTKRRSSVPPIITLKTTQPVRQFITAGADDQEVPDESIFRRQFVEALGGEGDLNDDGYITGSELADYLQEKVGNYTRLSQTPQYGKIFDPLLDKGDFVFVVPKSAASNTAGNQAVRPVNDVAPNFNNATVDPKVVEREAFRSIQNSTTIADIRAVLEEYPSSQYAAGAKTKLEGLVWNSVKHSKDKSKIQAYLDEFPNGANAPLARIELRKLNTAANNSTASTPPSTQPGKNSPNQAAAVWSRIKEIGRTLLKYDQVGAFPEGEELAYVVVGDWENGKKGFIDKTGREVIPLIYDYTEPFSEGLAKVGIGKSVSRKYGHIDTTGKEIIPIKYDNAGSFSEGLAWVRDYSPQNRKFVYLDKTGKEVIPIKYESADSFSEGLAAVSLGDYQTRKYGYIDKTGSEVIPVKYDAAGLFREGLAPVRVGDWKTGKWGYIDKNGREVIPFKYDDAQTFSSEGLALVQVGSEQNAKYGYIDKTGREIYSARWPGYWLFRGLSVISLRSIKDNTTKYGFVDRTGREVIPVKYDKIWCYAFRAEGFYGVILNGKKGFADIYGNEYFDF